MASAESHLLNNREVHVLVAIDQQPREASYTTTMDDGTKRASVHVLYWEKHPKDVLNPLAEDKGEVRSMPYEEWAKPENPINEPPVVQPITMEDIAGTDASALPSEAQDALRAFGGVGKDGKVLAAEAWGKG